MYFYWQAAHSPSQALQRVSLLKFRQHQGSVVCSNRSHSWLSKDCCGGHLCWRLESVSDAEHCCSARWNILSSPTILHVPSLSLQGKLQLSSVPMSEESSPLSCCKKAEVGARFYSHILQLHWWYAALSLSCAGFIYHWKVHRKDSKNSIDFFTWIHCYNRVLIFLLQ